MPHFTTHGIRTRSNVHAGNRNALPFGGEHLQPVGLDAEHRAPAPPGRTVGLERLLACQGGTHVVGDQPVGAVARRTAQRVGGGDVTHREHLGMTEHLQFGCDTDESVVVEQFGGQPAGVGAHPTDSPQHRVRGRRRLSGAPPHRLGRQLVAGESGCEHGTVAGMQPDAGVGEPAPDRLPGAGVMADQRPVAGVVEVDPGVRPGGRDLRGAADGRGTAADDDHRPRGGQALVRRPKVRVDLGGRLQGRLSPEAVADAGGDDQHVIRNLRRRTVGQSHRHGPGREVQPGQGAVHGADPVEAAEPAERDPVVAGPVVGPCQPPAEFLAADQSRLGRDSDDVGVAGELDRGQHAGVAHPGDDDPLPRHARTSTVSERAWVTV